VSYEEDTCVSYEEDTCVSYEEDTCVSYEEEDTCVAQPSHLAAGGSTKEHARNRVMGFGFGFSWGLELIGLRTPYY